MKIKIPIFVITAFLLFISVQTNAITFQDSIDIIVTRVKNSGQIQPGIPVLVGDINNFYTKKIDSNSAHIASQLQMALKQLIPDLNLIDLAENLTGIPSNSIIIKGTYKPEGKETNLSISLVEALGDGAIVYQTQMSFEDKKFQRKENSELIAVLDLEADQLDNEQIKIFSDVFRAEMNELDLFQIASSAEVDKLNLEAVQKSKQCNEDECIAIIGEQLGADRVVFGRIGKIADDYYVLSAKMININDGTLISRTVRHDQGLKSMYISLKMLAQKFAGTETTFQPITKQLEVVETIPAESQPALPPAPKSESTSGFEMPWWGWAIAAVAGLALASSFGGSDSGDSGGGGGGSGDSGSGGGDTGGGGGSSGGGSGDTGDVTITW